MNVKGGGVAFVYVVLNFGVLLSKGTHNTSTASIPTTTAHPTATTESTKNNTCDQNQTTLLPHTTSGSSKITETTVPTTASPATPKSTSSVAPQPASSATPKPTSTTTLKTISSTTLTTTSSATLKTTSSTTFKPPVTSNTSFSFKTIPYPTMTSVLSSTLPTSSSTYSSSISSKSPLSSSTTTVHPWYTPSTSTINNVTDSSANTSTTHVPKNEDNLGSHISAGTALGIFLIAFVFVGVGSFIFYKMKKKGNLPCQSCKVCLPRRRRRSSTSSRGPLTQDDATFVNITDPPRSERELFSIGEQDGGQDGRPSSMQRRGTEDDYFYDEIFGTSAFVDETTNRANTHLTVDDDDDDLGGLNIPDLVFKKSKRI
ncbi:mucin-5AC-like [Mercenaria mercenaria]|uniref:mucin-5AC-like n=1 Tax=Mercenaria mercenaria TaxID=6596 RepID=UPI00234E4E4B|nr:mucin-5AC-like [Mercenaria mercenaria]